MEQQIIVMKMVETYKNSKGSKVIMRRNFCKYVNLIHNNNNGYSLGVDDIAINEYIIFGDK